MIIIVAWLHVIFAMACSEVQPDVPRRDEAQDVGKGDCLPVLRCDPMTPIADAGAFVDHGGMYEYPIELVRNAAPSDPFPTNEEAVQTARKWIGVHFGSMSAGTDLMVQSVQQSASGHDRPVYSWDRGHTVTLRQTYLGVPLHASAVVYILGRNGLAGTVQLVRVEPVPGSMANVITSEDAMRSAKKFMQDKGASVNDIDVSGGSGSPRLEYVCLRIGDGSAVTRSEFRPQWVIVPGEPLMVDAHSGKAWLND